MSVLDDLNEGKNSAKSIEEALRRINDEAAAAGFSFASMADKMSAIAKNSNEFKSEINNAKKSFTDLTKSASDLAKATKDDLKNKKAADAFEKKALAARKKVAEVTSKIRVLQDKIANATDEEKQNLINAIETMEDGVQHSKSILRNFERISKTNEKLAKETQFIDRLAKGLNTIPGLGPLLAKPLQDASSAYRSMRLKEGSTKIQAMAAGAKGIADSFGPAFLLKSLISVDKSATLLAHNLQMSKREAEALKARFDIIALDSGKAFLNQKNLVKATIELSNALGVANRINDDLVQNQAFLTNQLGLSADESAELNKNAIFLNKTDKQINLEIADQVANLQKETGIALKLNKVFQAVAKANAGLQAAYGFNNKLIAEQVVLTQKLGLTIEQSSKMASQLLDFESSIAKELEAELLTGRDLNLEQARLLALQGKSTEAAAELAKQVGGTAELSKMNVIQQEALAASMGMERNELIKSVQQREVLAKLGNQELEDALKTEEGRRKILEVGGEQLLQQYEQESAASKFQAAVIKIEEAFGSMMAGPFGNFVDGLASALQSGTALKTIFGAIAAISLTRVIASVVSMSLSLFTAAGGAISLASALTLGVAAVAIAAGIGVAMAAAMDTKMAAKAQQTNANDFTFANGNLTGERKGGIQVNTAPEDVMIVGGSKLFGSNNNSNNNNTEIVMALKEQIKELKEIKSKDTNFVVNASPGADTFNFITEQQNVNEFKV
jgi:hypothetical protein